MPVQIKELKKEIAQLTKENKDLIYKIENAYDGGNIRHRLLKTSEVFTPPFLTNMMLDTLDVDWTLSTEELNDEFEFIDPTCGSGNMLIEIFKRGIQLENIKGVDLMPENVVMTKQRLLELAGYTDEHRAIVDENILCANGLEFDYNKFITHVDNDHSYKSPDRDLENGKILQDQKDAQALKKKEDEKRSREQQGADIANSIF